MQTSWENAFKYLKPTEVFNKNFWLKVDLDSAFLVKPLYVHASEGSLSMPGLFLVPVSCFNASEELVHRIAIYKSYSDVLFSSITHSHTSDLY